MSDNNAPSAPNYTPLINAISSTAGKDTGLADEQMAWARKQFAGDKATSNKAIASDQGISSSEADLAKSINNQYKTTYQPLEDKFAQEAQNYGSEANQELMAGRAGATSAHADEQARQNTLSNLESFGIDPSSTRYAALDANMQLQKGADVAAAQNQARVQTQQTGLGLEQAAIGQGEVMPSMAAGANNISLQGNSGAVNSGLATTASGASTMGTAPGYLNLANGAYGVYGSTLNNQFQNQLSSFNANQTAASGAGALLGTVAGSAAKIAPYAMMFAKGGAIPDIDDGDNDDIRPFVDHHFYVLHGFDDQGKRIEHVKAAVEHFFKSGNHVGSFESPEAAHEHMERQAYGKAKRMAVGGEVEGGDGTGGGQVSPQMSPSGGKAVDDVPAVADGRSPIMLNAGEFIIPKDVTAWKGQEFFQKMIEQSRKGRATASAQPTTKPAQPQRAVS
jgi:hypothetical protein